MDLVYAKMVETKLKTSPTTKISGQEVVNTMYHYYITNNGIYIVVFNMDYMLLVSGDMHRRSALRILRCRLM